MKRGGFTRSFRRRRLGSGACVAITIRATPPASSAHLSGSSWASSRSAEPEALIAWFAGLEIRPSRIGLEAGPLSQWLYAGIREAGFAIELLETRHVQNAFKACR